LSRIVCDTGPLLHLREAGCLEILQAAGEVHGSLGVILWAAATGHFQRFEAEKALDSLFRSSLWLSSQVRTQARAALRQIFSTP
jgi:hypothetical protein